MKRSFGERRPKIGTQEWRSWVMSRIRSYGNVTTEMRLVKLFRVHGLGGWRRHQPLPGKPDFVFRRSHVAVFVDGCFWHGCPHCGRRSKSNLDFWRPKIRATRKRDRANSARLTALGWRVVRVWEHELRRDAAGVVSRIAKLL